MKQKLLKLAKMLMNFKMIETDKGVLIINTELAVGAEVSVETESGDVIAAPDGEYIIDNQKITIKEGKIESIEEIEPEEEPATEPTVEPETLAEEPATEPDEKDLRIAELEGLLAEKEAVIDEQTAKIQELEEKLNKPVEEPVKMSATVSEKTIAKGALRYFEK